MVFKHTSVLLEETVDGLNIKPDGIYVDGTLGGGGHAYEVCSRLDSMGRFIGIDQDEAAIEAAGIRLRDFGERVTIVRSNYCDMKSRLQELGTFLSILSHILLTIHRYRHLYLYKQSMVSQWSCENFPHVCPQLKPYLVLCL